MSDIRDLAKKKKALEAVHKTDEELSEMASDFAGSVGSTGNVPKAAIGKIAQHIEQGSLRGLLRQLKNPAAIEKAEEVISSKVPLKEKSELIERMRKMIIEKLKK